MNTDEVLGVEDAVLVLACCIDNFGGVVLSLVLDHLAECVLNRGIVAIDKMAINESHRQRRLA